MSFADVTSAWAPPAKVAPVEWIPKHVRTPPESEEDRAFDFDLAPHVRGVFDAWDDESVREIYLCWATRNMKTSTLIALALYAAINTPRPMAFGSCDEPTLDRTWQEQLYPMLEACPDTAAQLPPLHRRGVKQSVRLSRCRIRRVFPTPSGSRVAGYAACYLFGSEWDKWKTFSTSPEADTARGLRQRAKGYPYDYKMIVESTPSRLQTSRIWSLLTAPTTDQRQYHVPCPHCGTHQLLLWSQLWHKLDARRRMDPAWAAEHAAYTCAKCEAKILNNERAEMMRRGIWLSAGTSIDKRGRVVGQRSVDSPYVGLGPLSSLYSLLTDWSQLVCERITCGNDREKHRDFRNGTLCLPWDPVRVRVSPHQLAARLCSAEPAGRVPAWGRFVTLGVDVQAEASLFVWVASAWGDGGLGAEIAHGYAHSFEELLGNVHTFPWTHADGGPPCPAMLTFVDSGAETEVVYQLCRAVSNMLPVKGLGTAIKAEYREVVLPANKRANERAVGDVRLVEVNTDMTEWWWQKRVEGRTHPEEQPYTLAAGSAIDIDFLDQLLNCQRVEEDPGNRPRWEKPHTSRPNDFRDALRYSKVAASFVTNHGKNWDRLPARTPAISAPKVQQRKRFTTPDGRPYLITER